MSDKKLGYRECYICKAAIPPLVSICWTCGYSQLPNPNAGGRPAEGKGQEDTGRKSGPADLNRRVDPSKADFKSGFRKK